MINVAILGCGSVGEIHARCLQSIEGARVTAFCDTFEQKAKELCERFHGSYAATDPARIFSDDSIDAVYICTYHDTHATLAVQAARAGKHVMMEKPLALTLEECDRVANAVEQSGISFMTGFKMRYYPSVARVREFIPKPIVTIAQMMDERWPSDFWANDPVRGGGNVLSQGCHTMDLVCYLNGSEPERIYAEGGNFTHPGIGITDTIVATIRFANGSIAGIVQGDAGQTPVVSKFSFQVLDGRRTAHLHDRLKAATLFDGETATEHRDEEERGYLEENRDFIQALQSGSKPPITHRDGIRATLLILKSFEAIKTGRPQEIRF